MALTSGRPQDHFFSNLHALLRVYVDAPIFIAAVADRTAPDGFRIRYQRNFEDRDALPVIDRSHIEQALRAKKVTLFGRLAKLPTGGFLRSADDSPGSIIVAPLVLDADVVGYIAMRNPLEGMYDAQDLNYASSAGDVAALVVRNSNAAEEIRRRSTELKMLLETARVLSSERNLPRLFARLHRLVGGVMDAGTFWIALGSSERGRMTIAYCVDHYRLIEVEEAIPLQGSLSGHVFRDGAPLLVQSAQEWEFYPSIVRGDEDDVVSALVVPMRVGPRTIGAISVQSPRARAYTERDRDLMVAIAEQATIAVENSQHFEAAEQHSRELTLLAHVSRALSTQLSLKSLYQTVCDEVRAVVDAPIFFVALESPDGKSLCMEYCIENAVVDALRQEQPLENSFARRVMESGTAVVMQNSKEIKRQSHRNVVSNNREVRSVAMAPLRIGDRSIGVVSAQSYGEGAYDEASVRLLTAIAEQLALAIQNAQLFGDAKNRADRDPLTNLFHHRYLKTRLDEEVLRARRFNRPLAVLMLDLDNFKLVNDSYGHPIGDEALRKLTSVLQATCRGSDIIGRYGGDEFMVILPETDQEHGLVIADRIEVELAERELRFEDGSAIPLHCSIGLAAFPADGPTPAALISKADAALYQSKRQGRPMARMQRIGTTQLRLEGNFAPVAELLGALLARDPATRTHLEHVNAVAKQFATRLGLTPEMTESLLLASVLHDVGKIAIPEEVLRKPGRLTHDEYAAIKRHPHVGAMLIEHIPGFKDASVGVMHHHERFDGQGYPDGFARTDIPLLARIVTLIDAFSAMLVDRPYHKGMSVSAALSELRRGAGTQFDPGLVDRFSAMIEETA
ncbi:MAG: diguanylate cyclase [Candidatus Eremiobacteraeota bacterium]|nr:diguanylate cyclase [Candidatus Eremiobacteraeota bacterium]